MTNLRHLGSSFTKTKLLPASVNIQSILGWYSSNKTNLFSVVSLLKMSNRKYNAVVFIKFWCSSSWEKFVCKRAALCVVFLTPYQRGHRHLQFIFSSDVGDHSDADLIVRHFHLFILFSFSEMEFIKRDLLYP